MGRLIDVKCPHCDETTMVDVGIVNDQNQQLVFCMNPNCGNYFVLFTDVIVNHKSCKILDRGDEPNFEAMYNRTQAEKAELLDRITTSRILRNSALEITEELLKICGENQITYLLTLQHRLVSMFTSVDIDEIIEDDKAINPEQLSRLKNNRS